MRLERKITEDINESTSFFDEPISADAKGEMWVDLQGVTLINSIGVMLWMKWFKNLPPELKVHITNAPLQVVIQASLVDGFFPPNTRIESFRSLFFCEPCEKEKIVVLKRRHDYFYTEDKGGSAEVRMPLVKCPTCASAMEPDFSGVRAFAFLKPLNP